MLIDYTREDIPKNIKNMISQYLLTVELYDTKIPRQNFDIQEQLQKIEKELID